MEAQPTIEALLEQGVQDLTKQANELAAAKGDELFKPVGVKKQDLAEYIVANTLAPADTQPPAAPAAPAETPAAPAAETPAPIAGTEAASAPAAPAAPEQAAQAPATPAAPAAPAAPVQPAAEAPAAAPAAPVAPVQPVGTPAAPVQPETPAPAPAEQPAPVQAPVYATPAHMADPNGVKEDTQKALTADALKHKQWLEQQPKMLFSIPLEPGEKIGAWQSYCVNGYRLVIKKGVMVELAIPIVEVLAERMNMQLGAGIGSQYLATRDDKIADALS